MGLTDGVLESTASRCLVATSAGIGCAGSSSSYGKCAQRTVRIIYALTEQAR